MEAWTSDDLVDEATTGGGRPVSQGAKGSVDRCLEGERVTIPMPTEEAAERLAQQASDLGAVVEIERRQPVS